MKGRANKKQKNRILLICVTVFMCALCLFSLFMFIRSFLPITAFELYGVTQYERSEIVGFSGLQLGQRLYDVDTDEVEKALLESCHYLQEVEVERKFPNKVVFRVEEKIPMWYIAVSGDCYVLDNEMVVIEETANRDRLVRTGVSELRLPNVRELVCGQLPQFGKDESELRAALELVDIMRNSPFKSRITLVNMVNRFEVYVTIDGKYNVELGAVHQVEEKLSKVYTLITRGELDDLAGANIYVSDNGTPIVDPIY